VRKNKEKISQEDHKLFHEIARSIRNNSAKYLEAGKWLDEYCSEDSYWQRKEKKLKKLQQKEKEFPVLGNIRHVKQLKEEISLGRTPALLVRFQEARNYLLEKYENEAFIPEKDAVRIILISWLLTDPDTEKSNLNITQLEKWSWEPIDDVTKMSRGYAQFLWSQEPYDNWMKLLRIAWEKVNIQIQASQSPSKKILGETWDVFGIQIHYNNLLLKFRKLSLLRKLIVYIIGLIVIVLIIMYYTRPLWRPIIRTTDHGSTESTNIFADVSKDGTILRSNHFPWKIEKSIDQDGNILYVIVDRRGDATAISVVPDNPEYTVYQSYGGMVIKYTCAEEKISDFTIKVKY